MENGIKLTNLDTTLEDILELLHNKDDGHKFECKVSRPNLHNFRIDIIKVIRKCYLCEKEHSIYDLVVRQDKRVTKLFLPKLVCKLCVVGVDNLLDKLKQVQPKHLKLLSKQLDN